jgi:hypothetical protein
MPSSDLSTPLHWEVLEQQLSWWCGDGFFFADCNKQLVLYAGDRLSRAFFFYAHPTCNADFMDLCGCTLQL